MIKVIPFTVEHVEGVVAVVLPIQQAEFEIPITLDAQADLKDIPGFYQHGGGTFWIALEDQKVVGTIALLDIGNTQTALRKMFVAATYRGSEHGVARKLLATLISWSTHEACERSTWEEHRSSLRRIASMRRTAFTRLTAKSCQKTSPSWSSTPSSIAVRSNASVRSSHLSQLSNLLYTGEHLRSRPAY